MASVLPMICLLTMVTLTSGGSSCDFDLVTGPYGVSDDAISASSTHRDCRIYTARITGSIGWCPDHDPNTLVGGEYLQVEFRNVSLLKAITTLGRKNDPQWVTSYKASTSMDGLNWTYILNATGDAMVFPGNFDIDTAVTNFLEGNVIAKFMRIYPMSYYRYRAMRLEVKGCVVTCGKCERWGAKLGLTGDVLQVLLDTNASNPGLCGVQCTKHADCESFLFDVTTARCRLLRSTSGGSYDTVNLDGLWYFAKT